MKIGSIGYNYSHDKSFEMYLPAGPGAWLFLLVKTPAKFEICGKSKIVKENFCVILSYDTPCRYSAAEDIYTDDWFYFSVDDTDVEHINELNIPINEIIPLGNIEELTHLMHILSYEHYSGEPFHDQIEQHYLNILLLKLSRIIKTGSRFSSDSLLDKNMHLTHIRIRIYTEPHTIGNIDSLASEAGMSRSGFQHSYKKMFGVNVLNDIIAGRIECAKRLLTSTSLTINQIAEQCGYSGSFAFIRQFKQKCGKTPTEYRKGI